MKNWFLIFALLLTSCSSEDCTSSHEDWKRWMTPNDRLKVLSTTAMIGDLVSYIGGGEVDEQVLIQGELDPHSYQLVKGDSEKLSFANVIFYNGLGLEHGPSLFYQLKTRTNAIPLGDRIQEQEPGTILFVEGAIDPHIWMDISLWVKTIPYIVEGLSQADPKHALIFEERGQELTKTLMNEHEQLLKQMKALPQEKRYLVTSHDAFNYFTRSYLAEENETSMSQWDKRFEAPEGLAPDSQLSSADIQSILDHVQKYNVEVLFPETNVSRDSLNKILSSGKELGLHLRIADQPLFGDAMGCPGSGGETYLGMVKSNVEIMIRNWNGGVEKNHEPK